MKASQIECEETGKRNDAKESTATESNFNLKPHGEAPESKAGSWPSLSRIINAIVTALAKSVENGDHYMFADQPEHSQATDRGNIWFGRMTPCIDRYWFNHSESRKFTFAHEVKRSKDEVSYRPLQPK